MGAMREPAVARERIRPWGDTANAIEIEVTEHALWRAAERFLCSTGADVIEAEVREALRAGRGKRTQSADDAVAIYVWTPDLIRIYALRYDGTRFYVTTSIRREERWARAMRTK